MERRCPLGSLSNNGPEKEVASNAVASASIESPERSKTPPSIAFNSSCESDGFAVWSRIDGADTVDVFE